MQSIHAALVLTLIATYIILQQAAASITCQCNTAIPDMQNAIPEACVPVMLVLQTLEKTPIVDP